VKIVIGGSSGTAQVTAYLGKRRIRLAADAGAMNVRQLDTSSGVVQWR